MKLFIRNNTKIIAITNLLQTFFLIEKSLDGYFDILPYLTLSIMPYYIQ